MLNKSLLALALALAFTGCGKAPEQATTTAETPAAVSQTAVQGTEATQPWWQDAVFYQIWPRSFYDTNADGTGDFKGIEAKLPYLQDLGINAIWLTPMFEAPSYHGYDFQDFYKVESDYGTMEEFENLIPTKTGDEVMDSMF